VVRVAAEESKVLEIISASAPNLLPPVRTVPLEREAKRARRRPSVLPYPRVRPWV
jgi:hypothetical protein